MSLLDNASLLLTPNAYKEGKLYSVIPSNGNGDFTVTRATTATRVNSAGLVDLVPYNLLQYSEVFSNAVWTKSALSITANTTTAPDGTLTADTLRIGVDASSVPHRLYQYSSTSPTGTYTASYYLKKANQKWVQLVYVSDSVFGLNSWANFDLENGVIGNIGSGAIATITDVGNGWYRCTLQAVSILNTGSTFCEVISTNNSNSLRYPFYQSLVAEDVCFIWGAQLVEGTSARDYLRTETRLNIPRIDYSLGGCPNILLEPQRTNLALQSSSFDSATWLKTSTTVTANSSTSPSGVADADTLNITTSSGFIRQLLNISSGISYNYSAYVKKSANTANNLFSLYYNNNIGSPNNGRFTAVVDLTNLTITTTAFGTLITGIPTIISSTLSDVGNGWYRASVAFTTGTAAGSSSAEIGFQANTTAVEFLAWGAQLEAGAYATSYIPTTTASVTRNRDQCVKTGITSLIGQTEGTLFVDAIGTKNVQATAKFLMQILGSKNISITFYGGNINVYSQLVDLSVPFTPNQIYKIAVCYSNSGNFRLFVNGVKTHDVNTYASGTYSDLGVGCRTVGDITAETSINSVQLYKTALTDAQCITLTTL